MFLTGQEEIEAMVRSIRDIARDLPAGESLTIPSSSS